MKKVLGILTLVMLFTLTTAFQAHSDGGIFTIISTGDKYSQTSALVLSMKTLDLELGYEVYVLLCGDAVNLALGEDTTRLVAPASKTPWEILGGLIERDVPVPVYVCPLVFNNPPYKNLINNYGLRPGVIRVWAGCEHPGPNDVTPGDMAVIMNTEGIKLFTYID
jgi:predicted peroxiredoxin